MTTRPPGRRPASARWKDDPLLRAVNCLTVRTALTWSDRLRRILARKAPREDPRERRIRLGLTYVSLLLDAQVRSLGEVFREHATRLERTRTRVQQAADQSSKMLLQQADSLEREAQLGRAWRRQQREFAARKRGRTGPKDPNLVRKILALRTRGRSSQQIANALHLTRDQVKGVVRRYAGPRSSS